MMHSPAFLSPNAARSSSPSPTGGRLVSTTGRALPLLGTALSADAAGGIARVTLEQRFRNPHAEPLAVTYSLPLPSDGAVSGFAFRIGGRRVVGEIDKKRAARERYEAALADGHSAALLEQDRSSLFTQEIGNIPPGEEVVVEVSVDQRLAWLDEGAWEWRFPTVVGPRYLGEAGRVPDADRVAQDIADGTIGAKVTLSCSIRDALAEGREPESPSHAIDRVASNGTARVTLHEKTGVSLDRDIVVRWAVATPRVGVTMDVARSRSRGASSDAHGLLTIVPPALDRSRRAVARDLVFLLDTSGSMQGEPLAQAVRVASAVIETLGDEDQLELIEFSSAARRWKKAPVSATSSARRDAIAWLGKLRASGSTEMHDGILEALSTVRAESQRQVVLVTDGMIGFESQVVSAVCDRLPAASRLHTVGVGSAVNRSLTGAAARAGHGVEIILGIGEDPERAAARLVARTNAPLLVDLSIAGSALLAHAPAKLPDLFAGAPALVGVSLRPEGGDLLVQGRTADGTWEQRLRVPAVERGHGNQALVALFGREMVEDLEMRLAANGGAREIDARIEDIGVDFQIATRLTSWVAISEDETVDPSDPLRRERMPHELPYGMSAEGLGLRSASAAHATPLKARLGNVQHLGAPMAAGSATDAAFGMAPPQGGAPRATKELVVEDVLEAPGYAGVPRGAPAPARSRSVLGALRDMFKGKGEASGEARSEAGAQRTGGASTTLRGRVAVQRGTELVVEVFAEVVDLVWGPAPTAHVTFADGQVAVATLDARRTTKNGTVAVGAAGRLSLVLPARFTGTVQSIEIELGGAIVTIVIG